jgi:hypothetical protein
MACRPHRRLATACLLGVLVIVVSTAEVSGASTAPATRFRLTKVVTPNNVVANGPDRPIIVYWSGSATFPVTVQDASRSCLAGYICNPVSHTFNTRGNPLVWVNAVACEGTVPPGFVFRYKIWAIDAKGRRTPKVPMNIPCKPG